MNLSHCRLFGPFAGPRRWIAALAIVLLSIAAAAGRDARSQERDGPLVIVATTGMIADAVAQIGGDRVEVTGLMGPGVDPHTYRQTRSDIVAMARADAVFWHGLYLEAQLEEFFLDLGQRKPVIAVAETLSRDVLLDHDQYEGRYDPHVWMDPRLWNRVVLGIRDALIGLDPAGRTLYEANAQSLSDKVTRLADWADRTLATVPEDARVLVTAHDAFKYFGRAYGFEVMGIQGISTESEAGLARVEALVDQIVERRIGAIFVESSVSDRNIRALIEGAAASGHEVVIGGELYSDAMGVPGTYEGTYIGMIDHNVTAIATALGGEAGPSGFDGQTEVSN